MGLEPARRFHVERDGEIILTATARRGKTISQDRHGDGGWDACYHAQNRLNLEEEGDGPIRRGDLIVMQKDAGKVHVRRYAEDDPRSGSVYSKRFQQVGAQLVVGEVGVPVHPDSLYRMPPERYEARLATYDEQIRHHERKLEQLHAERREFVERYERQRDNAADPAPGR